MRFILFLSLLLGLFQSTLTAMGTRLIEPYPMKTKHLKIEDGELLVYADYAGGEKIREVNRVTKINPDEKYLILYMDDLLNHPVSNYTNYVDVLKVSLDNSSLVSSSFDIWNIVKDDKKFSGVFYHDLVIDYRNGTANYTIKIKKGENTKIATGIIKLKPGYPVWDMDSFAFIGSRYMDIKSGGICYILVPQILKEPVPGRLIPSGKEEIETKAGRFKTIRYRFLVHPTKAYLDS